MNRVLLGVLAALLALVFGLGWWGKHQYDAASALRVENAVLVEDADRAAEAAKRDRQVLVARQAEMALQARKLALSQSALQKALQRNNSWSDTRVPDEVKEALRGP